MLKRNTKSILRAAGCSYVMLLVIVAFSGVIRAQSQDPANPTPITSNTVEGQAGAEGATYYYSYKAPKGSVTVTLKGQTNYYATQFKADFLNTAGDDLGNIYVSADDKGKSESKEFNFDSEQPVTVVVILLKDSSLKWQKYSLTFSGAVSFGESGGGKKDSPPGGLPDLVFSKVEYKEGNQKSSGLHLAEVHFCVRNVGNAQAGQFQVRLTIYNNSDESSGLWKKVSPNPRYFVFQGLEPGIVKCTSWVIESAEPVFVGRGRLLWIDPSNSQGMVKESNEKNNKSWTNWPPESIN